MHKGITQEKLADYLNVSFQAVSKWENGTSSPDISLLPKISTYFGVTIDELFTFNSDAHIERIENMLQNEAALSVTDENYARTQLLDLISHPEKKGDAYRLLAKLSNHRAKSYHDDGIKYAKKALEINPENKANHVMLIEASRGVSSDWNYDNHHKLTAYYQHFVNNNPDYKRGYMFLFNHLLEDERLEEASEVIDKIQAIEDNYVVLWCKGRIEKAKGNHPKAFELFDQMILEEPTNWLSYATRADEYARAGCYDESIKDNEQGFLLQPVPRYIDSQESRAMIYEIQGKYDEAIKMWSEAQQILKSDWKITFGAISDHPTNEIKRLEALK